MIDYKIGSQLPPHEVKFRYAPTLTGFEVIDVRTGRPVSRSYPTIAKANGHAQNLNAAARLGTKELARALGVGR